MAQQQQSLFQSNYGANMAQGLASTLGGAVQTSFSNKADKKQAGIEAGNLRSQAITLIEDTDYNLKQDATQLQMNLDNVKSQMAASGFKVSSDSIAMNAERAQMQFTSDYIYQQDQARKQYTNMMTQANQVEAAAKEKAKNNWLGLIIGGGINIAANAGMYYANK
jgi:hypothetical protein